MISPRCSARVGLLAVPGPVTLVAGLQPPGSQGRRVPAAAAPLLPADRYAPVFKQLQRMERRLNSGQDHEPTELRRAIERKMPMV